MLRQTRRFGVRALRKVLRKHDELMYHQNKNKQARDAYRSLAEDEAGDAQAAATPADVNLAGDRNHVIPKRQVTAAEIMVLQAIHGHGEVYNIQLEPSSGRDNTPHEQVRDHLMKVYGRTRVGSGGDRKPVLPAVFPGWPNVTLPRDADAAGIDPVLMNEDAIPRTRSGKRRKAAAAAAARETATEETADFTE